MILPGEEVMPAPGVTVAPPLAVPMPGFTIIGIPAETCASCCNVFTMSSAISEIAEAIFCQCSFALGLSLESFENSFSKALYILVFNADFNFSATNGILISKFSSHFLYLIESSLTQKKGTIRPTSSSKEEIKCLHYLLPQKMLRSIITPIKL